MNNNTGHIGQISITDTIAILQSEINNVKAEQTRITTYTEKLAVSTDSLFKLIDKLANIVNNNTTVIDIFEKQLKRKSILLGITTSATILLTIAFVWTLLT